MIPLSDVVLVDSNIFRLLTIPPEVTLVLNEIGSCGGCAQFCTNFHLIPENVHTTPVFAVYLV